MKPVYQTNTHEIFVYHSDIEVDETDKHRALLLRRLSDIRKRVETGGVLYDNILIKTDEGSIGKITSTVMGLQSGMMTHIDWKGHNGWIKSVDYKGMIGIATVVSSHVQKCFSAENSVSEIIENTDASELHNVDVQSLWNAYFNQ